MHHLFYQCTSTPNLKLMFLEPLSRTLPYAVKLARAWIALSGLASPLSTQNERDRGDGSYNCVKEWLDSEANSSGDFRSSTKHSTSQNHKKIQNPTSNYALFITHKNSVDFGHFRTVVIHRSFENDSFRSASKSCRKDTSCEVLRTPRRCREAQIGVRSASISGISRPENQHQFRGV